MRLGASGAGRGSESGAFPLAACEAGAGLRGGPVPPLATHEAGARRHWRGQVGGAEPSSAGAGAALSREGGRTGRGPAAR